MMMQFVSCEIINKLEKMKIQPKIIQLKSLSIDRLVKLENKIIKKAISIEQEQSSYSGDSKE